jgi:Domain of unknown function (DUF6249)/Protein of unknown function (DUF3040)
MRPAAAMRLLSILFRAAGGADCFIGAPETIGHPCRSNVLVFSQEVPVNGEEVMLIVTTLVIVSGVVLLVMAMQGRRRVREMQHLERLAMIERGLVPPPESDPTLFERHSGLEPTPSSRPAQRWRTAGITMIGFGLALVFLIGVASGEPEVGIGLGGAFAMVGAAFLFNARASQGSEIAPVRPVVRPTTRRPDLSSPSPAPSSPSPSSPPPPSLEG